MDLVVAAKREIARGVVQFTLRHPLGDALPAYTAGAHITVQTPAGLRRNYSLCGDPSLSSEYTIAVKLDAAGRGGSRSMGADVHAGSALRVGEPRNDFALATSMRRAILVAGGIGITPIYAMAQELHAQEVPFKLIYCSRDRACAAYADALEAADFASAITLHHDNGYPALAFDFWPVFEKPQAHTHVYCCGPQALMDAVQDMTGHWAPGSVHFESFGAGAVAAEPNEAFTVRLAQSGAQVQVSAEQTLLQALRAAGHTVASSCESGTCGSCKTRLVGGTAQHRDMVLMDDEKHSQIMVCVSRAAAGQELVLDL